jgi:hypothetical protein
MSKVSLFQPGCSGLTSTGGCQGSLNTTSPKRLATGAYTSTAIARWPLRSTGLLSSVQHAVGPGLVEAAAGHAHRQRQGAGALAGAGGALEGLPAVGGEPVRREEAVGAALEAECDGRGGGLGDGEPWRHGQRRERGHQDRGADQDGWGLVAEDAVRGELADAGARQAPRDQGKESDGGFGAGGVWGTPRGCPGGSPCLGLPRMQSGPGWGGWAAGRVGPSSGRRRPAGPGKTATPRGPRALDAPLLNRISPVVAGLYAHCAGSVNGRVPDAVAAAIMSRDVRDGPGCYDAGRVARVGEWK